MFLTHKFSPYLVNNFKSNDYLVFNIMNIHCLLEILNNCIIEQLELHIDNIMEYFPNIDIDNLNSSKLQNVINFLKCFNYINTLPNSKFGYKVWNTAKDINRYQIRCSPKNLNNNVTYVICEVYDNKIIFETWRLYLDKYTN